MHVMHHTIIAVDVEGFGARDDFHQHLVRDGLNAAVRQAFEHCGLSWGDCYHEDRGDGLIALAPTDASNRRIAECLPNELAARLREHNAGVDEAARIRMRVVVHFGEVERDEHGLSSRAVVHAFRLLDSSAVRAALAGSHGLLALITSAEFFRDVIDGNPATNPDIYRQVHVTAKETDAVAWVCLPDNHVTLPGEKPRRPRRKARRGRHYPGRRPPRTRPGVLVVVARLVPLLVALLVAGLFSDVFGAVPPDRGCVEPVQLNVNVSAEKAQVVQKLAAAFEAQSRSRYGCRRVNVQVTVAQSSDAVIGALGRGWSGEDDLRGVGPEPHVVLPDSRLEVAAAQDALRRNKRTDVSLADKGSIALSPLVLATPEPETGPAAVATQPRGWADVLAAAARPLPPGQAGPRVRRPSPVSSGTGLVATVALYSAALGADLAEHAFTTADAPRLLHGIELSVAAGDESGTLLCSMRQAARRSFASVVDSTVLVSEKAAGDYNDGSALGERCPPQQRSTTPQVHLTYPEEGTTYLDHPFVVVDWKNRPENVERQHLVRSFHDFLVGGEAQAEFRREGFRGRDGFLAESGDALQDRPPDLPVHSVDVAALLRAFHDARSSARVLFLVDVSAAMEEPFRDVGGTRLRAAADAVGRTLRSVGDKDEVGVWEFAEDLAGGSDHRELVALGRSTGRLGGRPRVAAADEALDRLRTSGRPARVHEALGAAITTLRESGAAEQDTHDAIVVIADGTRPEPDTARLVDQLRSGGRPESVFLIAFGSPVCSSARWREIDQATDGTCHEVTRIADIDAALDSVAAVLWGGGHG